MLTLDDLGLVLSENYQVRGKWYNPVTVGLQLLAQKWTLLLSLIESEAGKHWVKSFSALLHSSTTRRQNSYLHSRKLRPVCRGFQGGSIQPPLLLPHLLINVINVHSSILEDRANMGFNSVNCTHGVRYWWSFTSRSACNFQLCIYNHGACELERACWIFLFGQLVGTCECWWWKLKLNPSFTKFAYRPVN